MPQVTSSKIIAGIFLPLALFGIAYTARSYVVEVKLENESLSNVASVDSLIGHEENTEVVPFKLYARVPIFIYHSVRPYSEGESAEQDMYDVTPELFEKHLAYLQSHGYTSITLDQLDDYLTRGMTLPALKPVILTFDDGWENQYLYAFPLLKKYNMSGVFYVFTNPIGKHSAFMTWDQLREMDAAGMSIESHTLSHPYLNRLGTEDIRHEIAESRKVLEKELGKPAKHFATPFGVNSPAIVGAIKEAGYLTSRLIDDDIYQTDDDMYGLRGILTNDDYASFVKVLDQ